MTGGPGSGKTTLALRKAVRRIERGLEPGESALFLSFSRAAVARILEAAKLEAPALVRERLSIQTFHSFFWTILRAHAYLLGTPPKISILLPQDEKALSGGLDSRDEAWGAWITERDRLFHEEGRIAFDMFAPSAAELLKRSELLVRLVALRYPIIIVDEAQDTGQDAWQCVESLAKHTQVVCLADLDQQIFDYLPGVGPERIADIRSALAPYEADLGTENHRSADSEILTFGNDILSCSPRGSPYKGVSLLTYKPDKPPPNWNHLLRYALAKLYKEIRDETGAYPRSVAILVAGNRSALRLSHSLNALGTNKGKPVRHRLHFDEAEALLSARFAAFLLEPKSPDRTELDVAQCMEMLASARRATGRAASEVAKLREQALKIRSGKALKIKIAVALRQLLAYVSGGRLVGDPEADWLTVKRALRDTQQSELVRAAGQLDYLVAFRRGHRISAGLAAEWLRDGAYTNARTALDTAMAQEQILDGAEPVWGIQVMTFHKAKGKQFEGVIVVRESRHEEGGVESSFVWRGDRACPKFCVTGPLAGNCRQTRRHDDNPQARST